MSTYTDGLKILAKITEDERNWRSGMGQIEALLNAAQQADAALAEAERRTQAANNEVRRLGRERTELEESVKSVKATLDGFQANLATKESEKRERLSALDEQIKAKEAQLATANESLAKLAVLVKG